MDVGMGVQKVRWLFTKIQIEVSGHCNRMCKLCLYGNHHKPRDNGFMSEELYKKVIDELAVLGFQGRLNLNVYGEPLMHPKIVEFVKYARNKLSINTFIRMSTNGDFLIDELMNDLVWAGVNYLFITNYDNNYNEKLIKLRNKYPRHIGLRKAEDMNTVFNRCGLLKAGKESITETICDRIHLEMCVGWNGIIGLCCHDFYRPLGLGDANKKSIKKLWFGGRLLKHKKILGKEGGRKKVVLCKNCNYESQGNLLPVRY